MVTSPVKNNMIEDSNNIYKINPIINIKNLHFWYPDGTYALRGINLQVFDGDFIAIVGKNGSGKTTLAKIIAGLLKPKKGSVILFGKNLLQISRKEQIKLVGYSFQNPDHQLFCESVREELSFGPKNLHLNKKEIEMRVKEVAKMLDLEEYLDEHPFFLSKGLRLRVAVESILTMRPKVIIVDEPTTGQDWMQSVELMNLLKQLNSEGKTIIFLTHHMRYVAEFADRCIVMLDGRKIMDVPTRDAFSRFDYLELSYAKPPPVSLLTYKLFGVVALNMDEAVEIIKKQVIPNTSYR